MVVFGEIIGHNFVKGPSPAIFGQLNTEQIGADQKKDTYPCDCQTMSDNSPVAVQKAGCLLFPRIFFGEMLERTGWKCLSK